MGDCRNIVCALLLLTTFATRLDLVPTGAWSNGGLSLDPDNPKYGTHDWLAHHALDWIPDDMDFWIRGNLAVYLYGTELPDNRNAPLGDGIGDTQLHHVYYRSDGQLQDDSAARRARESYGEALSHLVAGNQRNASKWIGVVAHYISDLAVFGHVMGSGTEWGQEKHHQDYEEWVNEKTDRYESSFTVYLAFDGRLGLISAYDAALKLAYDTTFDGTGKGRTAKWMDDNYDLADPWFQGRVGESLNLAVSLLAEVVYTISEAAGIPEFHTPTTMLALVLVAVIVIRRFGPMKRPKYHTEFTKPSKNMMF